MGVEVLFNERNREFYDRAARVATGRALSSLNPARAISTAARFLSIALFQGEQAKKRATATLRGKTVPGILIASVTRRCNLSCGGCYSRTLRPDPSKELGDDRFLELFREAVALGVGTIMIAGGEPLLRRPLLEGVAAIPGVVVPVFTNGILVDGPYLDLFSSGRIFPIFSVEGDAAFTAGRRGEGVHELVLLHAAELRRRGAIFGFSVTLTSANADSVLSDGFLKTIEELGASILVLVEFVPVQSGTEALILRADQKAELARPGKFDGYHFLAVSLPGDEEYFGGCLAAGRGFIHLSDDGSLEACPFAPFSDVNAAESSLAEALESPLMRAIRERHAELTETSGGCALWNKRGWVASLGGCSARGVGRPVTAELC